MLINYQCCIFLLYKIFTCLTLLSLNRFLNWIYKFTHNWTLCRKTVSVVQAYWFQYCLVVDQEAFWGATEEFYISLWYDKCSSTDIRFFFQRLSGTWNKLPYDTREVLVNIEDITPAKKLIKQHLYQVFHLLNAHGLLTAHAHYARSLNTE